MTTKTGYNPLRWDCKKDGCFNVKRRPKIEVFSDCFPRRINFGDVDGIVELNGKALMLEWKTSVKAELPVGQRILYEKITRSGLVSVLIVIGCAETMVCEKSCVFFKGKQTEWVESALDQVKARIKNWVKWAQENQK